MVRKMRAWDAAPAERDLMKLLVEKVENRVGGRSGSKIQREIKRVLSTHAKADGWLEAPTLARALQATWLVGLEQGEVLNFCDGLAARMPGGKLSCDRFARYHNPVQVQRATGGSDVDVERAKALKTVLRDELERTARAELGAWTADDREPAAVAELARAGGEPARARVLGGLTPVRVHGLGRPGAEPSASAVAYFQPTRTVLFACGSSVVVDDLDEDDGQRVYCGHAEAVGCVAAHATRPVACSAMPAPCVWRLRSLEVLQVLGRGLFRGVRHVAFLGGHALAAAGADGGRDGLPFLAVFDSETGDVLGEHLVSCGRGGEVSGGSNGRVYVWRDGVCLASFAAHGTRPVRSLSCAPAGDAVLSAGDDGAVRRWAGPRLSAQGDCAIVASKRPASADAAAAAGAAVAGVVYARCLDGEGAAALAATARGTLMTVDVTTEAGKRGAVDGRKIRGLVLALEVVDGEGRRGIDAVDRAHGRDAYVVADADGLELRSAPAAAPDGPPDELRRGVVHTTKVARLAFLADDAHVVSLAKGDRAVVVWAADAGENYATGEHYSPGPSSASPAYLEAQVSQDDDAENCPPDAEEDGDWPF
ncbi:hypothetical protein JL722_1106 [Aureococcus anophagefferens]|nr:hypothetical protein JL722_1106 [Aureococcus anophagefferens]